MLAKGRETLKGVRIVHQRMPIQFTYLPRLQRVSVYILECRLFFVYCSITESLRPTRIAKTWSVSSPWIQHKSLILSDMLAVVVVLDSRKSEDSGDEKMMAMWWSLERGPVVLFREPSMSQLIQSRVWLSRKCLWARATAPGCLIENAKCSTRGLWDTYGSLTSIREHRPQPYCPDFVCN